MDILTGLFDRVFVYTNLNKIVGMVCQPFYNFGGHLEAAYTRRIAGVGPYFWERHQERVWCPECKVELAEGLLTAHQQDQHGKEWPPQLATRPVTPDPRIYRFYFPRDSGSIRRSVGGCEGRATTHTNLQIHFVNHHMQGMLVILEEGNFPHPH